MQACVLLVSILALGGLCLAGEESNIEPQTGDESCSHYCSATYPEHTYPEVRLYGLSLPLLTPAVFFTAR